VKIHFLKVKLPTHVFGFRQHDTVAQNLIRLNSAIMLIKKLVVISFTSTTVNKHKTYMTANLPYPN